MTHVVLDSTRNGSRRFDIIEADLMGRIEFEEGEERAKEHIIDLFVEDAYFDRAYVSTVEEYSTIILNAQGMIMEDESQLQLFYDKKRDFDDWTRKYIVDEDQATE